MLSLQRRYADKLSCRAITEASLVTASSGRCYFLIRNAQYARHLMMMESDVNIAARYQRVYDFFVSTVSL